MDLEWSSQPKMEYRLNLNIIQKMRPQLKTHKELNIVSSSKMNLKDSTIS